MQAPASHEPADPERIFRPPLWLPDVVLAVLVIVAPFMPSPVPEFRPQNEIAWVLVFSPLLVLPWRRRWPRAALVVLLIVFGALAFTGTLSPGVGVCIAAAMFQISTTGTRRTGIVVAIATIVALTLLSLPVSPGNVFDPRVLQFGLFVAFATAAGDGARSRRAYIAAITERAERAERTREAEAQRRVSEERLRIARDLHDAVAHQIAVISLSAGVASRAIETNPEKATQALATIRSAARAVLGEIGDLMTMLRAAEPGSAENTAPQHGLERIDDLVAQFRAAGLDVQTRVEGDLGRASGAVGLVAYRVLQEALTNAHKHGAEHRAHILLAVDDEAITITVTNPVAHSPSERDAEDAAGGSGVGLLGLRERVASVRGTVESGMAAAGWRIAARLPIPKEDA